MVSDYYKLLNLKRTATDAEINKAYRQQTLWRSRLNAPDLKLRQEAELMLVELEAAKNVLLNTKSYAIPQKYILIINALLLVISLDGIRKKGIMN